MTSTKFAVVFLLAVSIFNAVETWWGVSDKIVEAYHVETRR